MIIVTIGESDSRVSDTGKVDNRVVHFSAVGLNCQVAAVFSHVDFVMTVTSLTNGSTHLLNRDCVGTAPFNVDHYLRRLGWHMITCLIYLSVKSSFFISKAC